MCDTFVVLPQASADSSVIVAKNSDREPGEAHQLVRHDRGDHPAGGAVACTYITIPQARRTHCVLLAKPYWIWGAEMGVNEHGVVIGNEAVFTKTVDKSSDGLLGMDLVRLGLERAETAAQAVEVITTLLRQHGQGGNAGHRHQMRYDNSYVVADGGEAWVLETMGRDWVANRVAATAAISNALTTADRWDLSSVALQPGGALAGVDVAEHYSDFLYTKFSDAASRQCRVDGRLKAGAGSWTVADAMGQLRDHGPDGELDGWTPARGVTGATVCMHAGHGPIRVSQTTGSMVAHVAAGRTTVWLTGTAAPCTSVFKPVWLDSGLPDMGRPPNARFDQGAMWWRHELLHRATLRDYPRAMVLYRRERDELESQFRDDAATAPESAAERRQVTADAFLRSTEAADRWLARLSGGDLRGRRPGGLRSAAYRRAWRARDREAGLDR